MKKIELKAGDIYQKKGTLDVRTITWVGPTGVMIHYFDIGGDKKVMLIKSFCRWIHRNKIEKPIGHYDFDKKKARAVKCP